MNSRETRKKRKKSLKRFFKRTLFRLYGSRLISDKVAVKSQFKLSLKRKLDLKENTKSPT